MAIINCPECNWYISDKSLFCVRCGCCFVDFDGILKSLLTNMKKEIKETEIKEEIKAPIIKQPESKKPELSEQELKDQEIIKSIKIKKKLVMPTADDYENVIYTVPELRKVLGISINQAYVLARSKKFPVKHIGNKKVIPIKYFWEWFNNTSDIKKE